MSFATVVFDCDSTLSKLEGIEALATGVRDEVKALTDAAMEGRVPLEEVYGRRLELIRPTRASVDALVEAYIDGLVEDATETVRTLLDAGLDVRIISGGLLPAVAGLAAHLGVGPERVSAVPVHFHTDGSYAGFDPAPPARAGGKPVVIREWRAAGMPGPVLFVGDGATDLEAAGDVDLFAAYAGVAERPDVVEAAPVVIRCESLAPVTALALNAAPEGPGLDTYEKGMTLLDSDLVERRQH